MKRLLAISILAGCFAAVNAQNFVNGSFETGDFTGWTVTDASSGSFLFVPTYASFNFDTVDGSYFACFAATSGLPDMISQTIATNPGQVYTLSFYAGEDGGGSGENLDVTWDGINYFNSAVPSVPDPNTGLFAMTHYTMTVFGTGSDTATFSGFDGPAFIGLDDVTLTPATPEPASIAFLGLGAVGILLRRRRKN